MDKKDYHFMISNQKRKISNEIKFYNKLIDDKCNEIVSSMVYSTLPLAKVLREVKVTYMAPILIKRHSYNLVTHKLTMGKDFCDRLDIEDCEIKVLDQLLIHSIRNLIERSVKILSLFFVLSKSQKKVGFGFINEVGKTGGFIEYALSHEDDELCKYVITQYKDWIRCFCLTDNRVKHEESLRSVTDWNVWRERYKMGHIPALIMPTHYITGEEEKEVKIPISEMDDYIDRCYSFVNHIIDEVYSKLCNKPIES